MKFFSKLIMLFLSLCLSNNLLAEDQSSDSTPIRIIDMSYGAPDAPFDIGFPEKVTFKRVFQIYIDLLDAKDTESKINKAILYFKLDRLELSDEEILQRYNQLKTKVDRIINHNKLVLFTNYIPQLGKMGLRQTLISRLGNEMGAYDFKTERWYIYNSSDFEDNCDAPLITSTPIYMLLKTCKKPYVHIPRKELAKIRKYYGEPDFEAVLSFALDNEKKLEKCPSGSHCYKGDPMIKTKLVNMILFINMGNEVLKYQVEY